MSWLIVGLLIGYWGREVMNKVDKLVQNFKYQRDYAKAGIVKPSVYPAEPSVIDLTTKKKDSGIVRPLNPEQVMIRNNIERDAILKSKTGG